MCPSQVAFLDLRRMQVHADSNLLDVGPSSCVSGRLHLVMGQMGTGSQVNP